MPFSHPHAAPAQPADPGLPLPDRASFERLLSQHARLLTLATFEIKARHKAFNDGARGAANLGSLPRGQQQRIHPHPTETPGVEHWIELDYRDPDGTAIPEAGYEIHFVEGPALAGTLDTQGQARRENLPGKTVKKVVYTPRKPEHDEPLPPLGELLG